MTSNDDAAQDVFLTTDEIFARYRCGRSKGYELLKSPGFPPKIGMGYSLAAIARWEQSQLGVQNTPTPTQTPTSTSQCADCSAPAPAPSADRPTVAAVDLSVCELGPPRTRSSARPGEVL